MVQCTTLIITILFVTTFFDICASSPFSYRLKKNRFRTNSVEPDDHMVPLCKHVHVHDVSKCAYGYYVLSSTVPCRICFKGPGQRDCNDYSARCHPDLECITDEYGSDVCVGSIFSLTKLTTMD